MGIEEIKAAIKNLSPEERRKVAVYILELERDHVQHTIGPQIAEDLEAFSRIVQDSVEKIRKMVTGA
jgi:VIT1/CCC1 family predicted Fe2+/Mn2+ transporter